METRYLTATDVNNLSHQVSLKPLGRRRWLYVRKDGKSILIRCTDFDGRALKFASASRRIG